MVFPPFHSTVVLCFFRLFCSTKNSCTITINFIELFAALMGKHTKQNANWEDALVDKRQHLYRLRIKDSAKVSMQYRLCAIFFLFYFHLVGFSLHHFVGVLFHFVSIFYHITNTIYILCLGSAHLKSEVIQEHQAN